MNYHQTSAMCSNVAIKALSIAAPGTPQQAVFQAHGLLEELECSEAQDGGALGPDSELLTHEPLATAALLAALTHLQAYF